MYNMNNKIFTFGLSERLMELQRREFLKLVGTAAVVSSAFGV
jgi:hypothetical protein